MSHSDFNHLLESIKALSPEQMRELRRQLDSELASAEANPAAAAEPPTTVPAWQRVLDNMSDVPDEEFARMPANGSEQLDHYVYGTPKRPAAR
jgi:hypothetical protein